MNELSELAHIDKRMKGLVRQGQQLKDMQDEAYCRFRIRPSEEGLLEVETLAERIKAIGWVVDDLVRQADDIVWTA